MFEHSSLVGCVMLAVLCFCVRSGVSYGIVMLAVFSGVVRLAHGADGAGTGVSISEHLVSGVTDNAIEQLSSLLTKGRTTIETSAFYVPGQTRYAEVALTWSPEKLHTNPDLFLHASGALGNWRESNHRLPDKQISFQEQELGAGWRRSIGEARVTTIISAHFAEASGDEQWQRIGVRASTQLTFNPSPDSFVSTFLRADSVRQSIEATLSTGWATPLGVKLGPEFGFLTARTAHGTRAGLALTGWALFGAELCLSGGYASSGSGRRGAYTGAYLRHPF